MSEQDKFLAMVSARAEVDLRLSDFEPRTMLDTPEHLPEKPRFPAIDFHNHLDAMEPEDLLPLMDRCGIAHLVNITMKVGDDGLAMIRKFAGHPTGRFSAIGWMDWTDLTEPGFFERSVDRLRAMVDQGAIGLKIWKDLGTSLRDVSGELLRVDDERLAPVFDEAARLGVFVMFHIADPDAFFLPIDRFNERYEELAAHPEWSFHGSSYSKTDLLAQRDAVFARHPETSFIAAHVAEKPENLDYVGRLLESHPNLSVDIGARVAELGRQPYTARDFFLKWSDRILFGTDLVPDDEMYRLHFRFLETSDQYFDYPSHASRQGRWKVYGLNLPDPVLLNVYRENALKFLKPGSNQRA